jgi:hypothetical protein
MSLQNLFPNGQSYAAAGKHFLLMQSLEHAKNPFQVSRLNAITLPIQPGGDHPFRLISAPKLSRKLHFPTASAFESRAMTLETSSAQNCAKGLRSQVTKVRLHSLFPGKTTKNAAQTL